MNESPIFSKIHDLLVWLLQATRKFPREHRFTLAEEISNQCFALQRALVAASLDKRQEAEHLLAADIALTCLRRTLLICHEMKLLDDVPYRHVTQMTSEVGRLLGAWRKRAG